MSSGGGGDGGEGGRGGGGLEQDVGGHQQHSENRGDVAWEKGIFEIQTWQCESESIGKKQNWVRVFYSSMSAGSPCEKYSEGFSLAWGRRHGVDAGGDGVVGVGEHL